MIGQRKTGSGRNVCKCTFCPPGSNTSEDALPLVLIGDEGNRIAKLLSLSGNEACCYHCRALITRIVTAEKKT